MTSLVINVGVGSICWKFPLQLLISSIQSTDKEYLSVIRLVTFMIKRKMKSLHCQVYGRQLEPYLQLFLDRGGVILSTS